MRGPLLLLALTGGVGCTAGRIPDPKAFAAEYSAAAGRGDADALYNMLSEGTRRARSKEDVRRAVKETRGELAELGKAFGDPGLQAEATARLRFEDGEEAALELQEGRFWVSAAGALPGGARTPEQALEQLRRVLARRSYAGLMRVLSPATRNAIEQDLRSLVLGLDKAETLPVQVTGETATVNIPGGHRVRLKRDGGIWRIDDFE